MPTEDGLLCSRLLGGIFFYYLIVVDLGKNFLPRSAESYRAIIFGCPRFSHNHAFTHCEKLIAFVRCNPPTISISSHTWTHPNLLLLLFLNVNLLKNCI